MQQLWQRLESILANTHPSILADLAPPATDTEISNLQQQLGVKLPDDFIACLKIHNGQRAKADGLFDGSEFLSTSRKLQEWTIMKDVFNDDELEDLNPENLSIDGVKAGAWIEKWIPIIGYGNGDLCCLDLDPGEGGNHGQVIQYWHEDFETQNAAHNFKQWFAHFIDQLN